MVITSTLRAGLIACLIAGFAAESAWGAPPREKWFPAAPPLPQPTEGIIEVSSVDELVRAVHEVKPGGTVLIEDGNYLLRKVLIISKDNVTIRSRSGNRCAVILDSKESRNSETVRVTGSRGVTVADLTIQNAKWNAFKIASELGAQRVTLYNCVIHNAWQRGVKAPQIPQDRPELRPRDCRIQFCLFYNDRPKKVSDDDSDKFQGNYIGGIDAKTSIGWTISDNVFLGIHGRTFEARAAIFISDDGLDCVIERNIIIDCDVGIALGNPARKQYPVHCKNCIVRNNFVTRAPETGILACYTKDCQILHNTIHDPSSKRRRLIFIEEANDGLLIANNLLSGPPMNMQTDSDVRVQDNLVAGDLAAIFADPVAGDLHLRTAVDTVVDRGSRLAMVSHDFDNQPRLSPPDLGADEFGFSALAAARTFHRENGPRRGSGPAPGSKIGSEPAEAPESPLPGNAFADDKNGLPYWVEPMRKLHAGFVGQAGYVAQLGDSITNSLAFWAPIGFDDAEKYLVANDGLPKTPPGQRWRDVILGVRDKGREHGNASGWRVQQVLAAVDDVLSQERPEVAIIMVGTNDIASGRIPKNYRRDLEQLVGKCFDAHCVPILSTIPPRKDREQAVDDLNGIVRRVAAGFQVPLVDFHTACLKRRPGDSWLGTVIGADGVHPTGDQNNIYTEESMKDCGYALRNWVCFLMVRQVYFHVLHPLEGAESRP